MADSWRPRQSQTERLGRHLLSMAPGAVNGRIAQARPMPHNRPSRDGQGATVPVTFSFDGAPEVGNPSPAYINLDSDAAIGTIVANTTATTTTATTLQVLHNGVAIATLTLPLGAPSYVETLVEDVYLAYGDRLQVVCTALGNLLNDVVVQILLSVDDA